MSHDSLKLWNLCGAKLALPDMILPCVAVGNDLSKTPPVRRLTHPYAPRENHCKLDRHWLLDRPRPTTMNCNSAHRNHLAELPLRRNVNEFQGKLHCHGDSI